MFTASFFFIICILIVVTINSIRSVKRYYLRLSRGETLLGSVMAWTNGECRKHSATIVASLVQIQQSQQKEETLVAHSKIKFFISIDYLC